MGDSRIFGDVAQKLKPNPQAMEKAIGDFLEAAGFSLEHPQLRHTPQRVVKVWLERFLDGYACLPKQFLEERFPSPAEEGQMVLLHHIRFHSMCPHHLLPYEGYAHMAYVPSQSIVGFGRLAALLQGFAHRLSLQEDIASNVAHTLYTELHAQGAACILQARQCCLRLRRAHCVDAWTQAEAYEGKFKTESALQQALWLRIQSSTPNP
ncbi:MAG: GTP cyclohydrolase I [Cystobacterineae bacterium]|nr:GTP cyclohydrolase I [Cystobacterineae bacterium]